MGNLTVGQPVPTSAGQFAIALCSQLDQRSSEFSISFRIRDGPHGSFSPERNVVISLRLIRAHGPLRKPWPASRCWRS